MVTGYPIKIHLSPVALRHQISFNLPLLSLLKKQCKYASNKLILAPIFLLILHRFYRYSGIYSKHTSSYPMAPSGINHKIQKVSCTHQTISIYKNIILRPLYNCKRLHSVFGIQLFPVNIVSDKLVQVMRNKSYKNRGINNGKNREVSQLSTPIQKCCFFNGKPMLDSTCFNQKTGLCLFSPVDQWGSSGVFLLEHCSRSSL